MKEYSRVRLVVEKEKYAKKGAHKGMDGWICDPRNIDGDWLVCFDDEEKYRVFINDYKIDTLQRFADNVIFELGTTPNGKRDDMSIIALKILKNSPK